MCRLVCFVFAAELQMLFARFMAMRDFTGAGIASVLYGITTFLSANPNWEISLETAQMYGKRPLSLLG